MHLLATRTLSFSHLFHIGWIPKGLKKMHYLMFRIRIRIDFWLSWIHIIIRLLRNSLRNHPEIPNNTKNQNSEQKVIRIHTKRSHQQKSNDNSENFLVKFVFLIYAYDNNCLYWIEKKLFLFYLYPDPVAIKLTKIFVVKELYQLQHTFNYKGVCF
jgi:hypothetical protein